jgi:hypothetical protein
MKTKKMYFYFLIYLKNLYYICFEYVNYILSGRSLLYVRYVVYTVRVCWLAGDRIIVEQFHSDVVDGW